MGDSLNYSQNNEELSKERKVVNRKHKEVERVKHYYSIHDGFSKENTFLPKDYRNKIITGDSLQVLKKLPNNCIDLIFTSPPYNFGLDYAEGYDARYWGLYFENLFKIFDECIRVLKYSGRFIVNVQPLFSDYIPTHHIISKYLMDKKLVWKGEILWEKNNYNCKYTAWGSWKSPSSPYLKYTWEFIEVFCKGTMKKSGDKSKSDITSDEFKEWVLAKWSIAPERNMKKFGHPAVFPEALAERVIKLFSYKNDVVLDPFNGVGTTTLVAHKTGRQYVGVDISKDHSAVARTRVKNARQKTKRRSS
jgi:DNA modification methylase